MSDAKPLEERAVGLRAWAADHERGLGGVDKRCCVGEVFCGEHIVAGALEQGAEVSE